MPQDFYSYEASGSIIIKSNPVFPTLVRVYYHIDTEFSWNIKSFLGFEYDFIWSIGDSPLFYYRIEGECVESSCETTGIETNDEKCGVPPPDGQKILVTIAARNLKDLAERLRDNYPPNWPIKSIKRFSKPVYFSEDFDEDCSEYVDMAFCDLPEFFNYCSIEGDSRVHMGISTDTTEVFFFFTSQGGGLKFSGKADTTRKYKASGGISISGKSNVMSSHYNYTAFGEMVFLNRSNPVVDYYKYESNVSLKIKSDSLFLSPYYTYKARVQPNIDIVWVIDETDRLSGKTVEWIGKTINVMRAKFISINCNPNFSLVGYGYEKFDDDPRIIEGFTSIKCTEEEETQYVFAKDTQEDTEFFNLQSSFDEDNLYINCGLHEWIGPSQGINWQQLAVNFENENEVKLTSFWTERNNPVLGNGFLHHITTIFDIDYNITKNTKLKFDYKTVPVPLPWNPTFRSTNGAFNMIGFAEEEFNSRSPLKPGGNGLDVIQYGTPTCLASIEGGSLLHPLFQPGFFSNQFFQTLGPPPLTLRSFNFAYWFWLSSYGWISDPSIDWFRGGEWEYSFLNKFGDWHSYEIPIGEIYSNSSTKSKSRLTNYKKLIIRHMSFLQHHWQLVDGDPNSPGGGVTPEGVTGFVLGIDGNPDNFSEYSNTYYRNIKLYETGTDVLKEEKIIISTEEKEKKSDLGILCTTSFSEDALSRIKSTGTIADGYEAIDFAIDNIDWSNNSKKIIILVTNNRRIVKDASINYNDVHQKLNDNEIGLNSILDIKIENKDIDFISPIGLNDKEVYVAEGITFRKDKSIQNYRVREYDYSKGIIDDYYDLTVENHGTVWSLRDLAFLNTDALITALNNEKFDFGKTRKGLLFSGNSRTGLVYKYSPIYPLIQISGSANAFIRNYGYVASGSIKLSSSTISNKQPGESNVILKLSSDTKVTSTHWQYVASGGIVIWYIPNIKSNVVLNLSGSAEANIIFKYTGSGGIVFSGDTISASDHYSYVSDVVLDISGEADVSGSDLGTFNVDMSIEGDTILEEANYNTVDLDGPELPTLGVTTVSTDCNCFNVPINLFLTHNLNNNNLLSNFLNRNNFILNKEIPLRNVSGQSWRKTISFVGRGDLGALNERWNIIFEFECTNIFETKPLPSNLWKFSMFLNRINLDTEEDFDSRILYYFNTNENCIGFNDDNIVIQSLFDFSFNINVRNKMVFTNSKTNIFFDLIYDDIGMFNNVFWNKNPLLRVKISESPTTTLLRRYNIQRFVPLF